MNDTKLDLDADDLETLMKKGVESGQKDWTKWKENKDDDSIKKKLTVPHLHLLLPKMLYLKFFY